MAQFDANMIRAVSIELQRRVQEVYLEILPIYTITKQWTLNGFDPMLPAPFDVRVPLAAYKKLSLPGLRLDEWITALLKAAPGDVLTYPPVIAGGLLIFDDTVIFSETIIF